MNVSDILSMVRVHLADTTKTRWSDPNLLHYFAGAVHEAAELRSDLLLTDHGLMTLQEEFDATDTLDWPLATRLPLVMLTTAAALQEDSDDRTNLERASTYRSTALAGLTGLGRTGKA